MGRKRSAGNERLGEHLQRKSSGVIELRFPLPEDVRYAFPDDQGRPRKQFIQSLGTRDVQTANNKADPIRTAIKDRISRIYAARKGDELPNFLRQIYEWEVGEADPPIQADAEVARRRALVGLDEEPANVIPIRPQRISDAIAAVLDKPPSREVRMLDRVLHGRSLAKPHHQPGEKAALAGWVADAYFEEVLGVRPAPSSPEYQAVLHQGFETLADAHFAKMDIEAGRTPPPSKYGGAPEGRKVSEDGNEALAECGLLPLSRYFEDVYLPSLETGRKTPGERYLPEKRYAIKVFIELHGDKPLFAITKTDMWQFHDNLMHMPSTRALTGGWRGKDAASILKAAKAGTFGTETLSPKTINKRLSSVSTLLEFAVKRRHIRLSVAEKVRAELNEDDGDDEKGRPFTTDELNRIFRQPIFCGSSEDSEPHGYLKPGKFKERGDRFWIPLALFLTGCRAAEIIGIRNEEVVLDAEVPHFLIVRNAVRRLKNPQSQRMIPVHPYLIRAGFVEFATARRQSGEDRLFPQAKQEFYNDSTTGQRTAKSLSNALIVRQFNRTILARADARSDRGSIKCFRNTFEEEALVKVREEEVRLRLTGRRVPNSSTIYKEAIPADPVKRAERLKLLHGAISSMTFDAVNLSHLWKS